MARANAAILAILAATAVVAGCGGGGSSSGSSSGGESGSDSAPLTKVAFVEQGNVICVQSEKERSAAGKAAAKEGGGSSDEELESYVANVIAPSVKSMTSGLGGLRAPKGDEKQVERMIAAFEASLRKLESEPKLAFEGNPFSAPSQMAAAYGLTDCVI